MEQMRLEKERHDLSSIHRKIEMSEIENEIERKRQEMAQKRAEDLADSYLKTKNLKVLNYGFFRFDFLDFVKILL